MSEKYPDWAPPNVISLFTSLKSSELHNTDLEFIERWEKIIRDNRMEKVWKALQKRTKHELDAVFFSNIISDGFSGPNAWEKMSLKEKRVWKNETIKLIKELSNNFDKSVLKEVSPLAYFPRDVTTKFKNKDDVIRNENGEEITDWTEPFFSMSFTSSSINSLYNVSISDYFKGMASTVKEINIEDEVLNRPNIQNHHLLYFIRVLGGYLILHYGTPLYEVVETTASVLFPDIIITKDKVKAALKPLLHDNNKIITRNF